ncbi:MAG: phenylacetate-CoA oxygenase subunit PaaJ [Bacteroidia bacterium]|nr:phenylacetate-CoA oxygenase subunit PaaJ [Bacteroidia bacterium]
MLTRESVYQLLTQVMDPEIPVLSVVKLGIIDDVRVTGADVEIDMVPTFAGCPAIEIMKGQIIAKVKEAGAKEITVNVKFKKAWSTNQITTEGKKTLREFGISPPPSFEGEVTLELLEHAECPKCGSTKTRLMSSFGPTACRAIHHCDSCHETFEQMKPL